MTTLFPRKEVITQKNSYLHALPLRFFLHSSNHSPSSSPLLSPPPSTCALSPPPSSQVALFRRLLLMVRNLRVEADRMHALACICRAALVVDLFGKESAHRGQRPVAGSDIGVSLFADPQVGGQAGRQAGR